MGNKYKTEIWNKTKWKGTKRETVGTQKVLVKRDAKGHFAKDTPVIREIKTKTYGTGVYNVGYSKGKIKTRQLTATKTQEWYEKRKEIIKNRTIFRCSIVLNDIPSTRPTGRNEYYGFRIIAFSHSKRLLNSIYPDKMRERLIRFIEQCLRYKSDDFWFGYSKGFFGHENISINNTSETDNGKFVLQWQKRYGAIMKIEQHYIRELI